MISITKYISHIQVTYPNPCSVPRGVTCVDYDYDYDYDYDADYDYDYDALGKRKRTPGKPTRGILKGFDVFDCC